jgi:hypothetical protein
VIRYPVTAPGARPFIDCPVHGCVVVLGDDGRIRSRCPLRNEFFSVRLVLRELIRMARSEASRV